MIIIQVYRIPFGLYLHNSKFLSSQGKSKLKLFHKRLTIKLEIEPYNV